VVGSLIDNMSFALYFLILIETIAFWALVRSLQYAPDGYEDELSFHFNGVR